MAVHASTFDRPSARVSRGAIGATHWEVATTTLDPRLAAFVGGLTGYAESSASPVHRRELPGTRVVVCFELGEPIRVFDRDGPRAHRGGFVAGLGGGPTGTEHDGAQRGIQLDLSVIGAQALFGIPMGELAGRAVSILDLVGVDDRPLLRALEDAPDWDARLHLVEGFVRARVARADPRGDVVDWALRRIAACGGAIETRMLAKELGYSDKHVIALFRARVGVTPGAFARLVRFERLVAAVRAFPGKSWAELAHAAGYYDQPHLAREVRRLAASTPAELRASLVDLTKLPVSEPDTEGWAR